MKLKIETKNANETMAIAQKFGRSVFPPCVISLVGDLGAGKTTFAKGFALGFGIEETITSPTFTLLNEYQNKEKKLYHFDLYRLADLEEAHSLGFEEYFDLTKLDGVVLVEWASNAEGILPARHYQINFVKKSDTERLIEIEPKGLI
ncbi:MAG: tRNA (adenosine(37)-N6)-threonylcarbamoyltransferase complex ATPase subunit type 1 TsaE [Clostridia bacterium]|nr:tRNA (adenosine(37)-N6)-threonylcarbamoyltransferase complex ATPase subunit type 1 TsaE [Clostridia bacterium]